MSSIEIEAKMPLADAAGLEARLVALGAVRGPGVLEVNTFFDTDQGQLKSTDSGLRLRVQRENGSTEPVAYLTFKGPRTHGALKSRTEIEVTVGDARSAADLLMALGFVAGFSFEKRRRRWELDGCHVDLDELPYLGHFVEIEGPSESAVLAVRQRLGLGEVPMVRASYISMLSHYLSEHRLSVEHVRFMAEGPAAGPAAPAGPASRPTGKVRSRRSGG